MPTRASGFVVLGIGLGFAACRGASAVPGPAPAHTPAGIEAGVGAPPDAGDAASALPAPLVFDGPPIEGAKAGAWSWIPFPDSQCANGTPTGIGLNLGSNNRVLLYLDAGGACWDAVTCYQLKLAEYIDTGFGEPEFETYATTPTANTFNDRTDPTNPYKDYTLVYVPYCTGDLHLGDRVMTYDGKVTRHVGRLNVIAFLRRLAPTFASSERVVLAGASAGGVGALALWWLVKSAFASTRVDLLDDSGPILPADQNPFAAQQTAAWDLDAAKPPNCAPCATDLAAVVPYYQTLDPAARFAFLSSEQDATMSEFYLKSPDQFQASLDGFVAATFASPRAQAFLVAGSTHVQLLDMKTTTGTPAESLAAWLGAMENDDDAWKTLSP